MLRNTVMALAALGWAACLASSVVLGANRSYDGTGNNEDHTDWGAAGTPLARMLPADYADGLSAPAGVGRPSARQISNDAIAQNILIPNTHQMTDWVFQWGQFVDHDVDLTGAATPAEDFNIPVPADDPYFDPMHTGSQVIPLQRSVYVDDSNGVRQQINQITSYLDGSMIYGSDVSRAMALREKAGGRLKVSAGDLLPYNTMGLDNATGGHPDPTQFYVAGDIRANEQVGLTAIHTLFVREHNRLANDLALHHPDWDDEQLYQRARKLVGAEIQVITYREWLPALLGPYAPSADGTYDLDLSASILNEFSTALFRVGHTMLPPQLMRITDEGDEAPGGHMSLASAFFKPNSLAAPGELDYLLKGLATDQQQEVDMHVIDEVRNFLFGPPGAGGLDLPSLNIQRGRDHGLPDYNSVRVAFGLPEVTSFAEITSDVATQLALEALYTDVDNIDAWVGAIAEDHLPGAAVGRLITAGLVEQFRRLRDGDRFWYQNDPELSPIDIARLESVRLSDIIRRNTAITNIQANVFFMVPEPAGSVLVLLALVGAWASGRRLR